MELRIGHLYPDQLNIYGDRGNILALYQRCCWRDLSAVITEIPLGVEVDPLAYDLFFMGGGQDSQQIKVCEDLHQKKASGLKEAAERGVVFLTICGGYQLLGHYYKPHQGDNLPGLGLIDAYTIAGNQRFIGNVSIRRPDGSTVVGFENHSGLTYLGEGVQPLGTVLEGSGNNGQDRQEGAVVGNIYGTYLHGSLLPKNPFLADELIIKALQTRYQVEIRLKPLEDSLETKAHQKALAFKA
ncbi:MAG: glutamine amidotransferase [Cyanobacteria bacterium]|nr:glutamine amidotransferase [Cyanobacteriota bacterium]